jgi:hypothetical protein
MNFLSKSCETKEQVLVAIQKAAAANKENYDKIHRNLTFEVGDQCLIYKPYRKKGLSDKLLCRMDGPYNVLKKQSNVTYKVRIEV